MTKPRKTPDQLRSARWFGPDNLRSFLHRSRVLQLGLGPEDYAGKPVIAVVNTWSEINPCHAHFRERAEDVKRGVLQAGGLPVEIPAMSLFESLVKPTAMLHRNLLAMEVEEQLRSLPVDGAVLMGGCDKTTPGLLMGAISLGLPCLYVPAGPMLRGNWNGKTLGSGSDAFKFWDERTRGAIDAKEWLDIEAGIARSAGHCMTMGTASTMTAIAEALGLTLPGASSIPAVDVSHNRMAAAAGRRAVAMVWEDLTPQRVLSAASFENAIAVAMAMGCSTNAVIHLVAMARRAGCDVTLDDFDRLSRIVPVIANVRPSGDTYLMEDFYFAGGLRGLMSRLKSFLRPEAATVCGETLGATLDGARVFNDDVIRLLDRPIYAEGALAVLRGNLAPDGGILKPSACAPHLLRHTGPALVFDSYGELKANIDRDDLDVTPDHVLVLRNGGPQGGPGMPEIGMVPIPTKLVRQGVKDMVRLSDARMSGTSYGACVLHIAPESHIGGPLALLRSGDPVTLDVPARRLDMQVNEEELTRRRAAWNPPPPRFGRGYGWMFARHVRQAPEGCDFDFLETGFGASVPEPDVF